MTPFDKMNSAYARMTQAATSEVIDRGEFISRIKTFESAFREWTGGIPELTDEAKKTMSKYPVGSDVIYAGHHAATVIGYKSVLLAEGKWHLEVRIRWHSNNTEGQFTPRSRKFEPSREAK